MTRSDEAGSDEYRRTSGPQRPWWDDRELQRARLRSQVELIVRSLPDVGVFPPDAADMQYMYRGGVILVRDSDVERVRQVLGGSRPTDRTGTAEASDDFVEDGLVSGITALRVDDTVSALETVDTRLGIGVATPDHVFWVTPAGCCPATEPENPGVLSPYPPVSTDLDCDGDGVLALVVDTGFLPSLVNTSHRWLAGVEGEEELYDPTAIGPYTGHGTFVAGVLRCMAPRAEVVVKGFLRNGGAVFESNIIRELYKALDLTPDVISLSAGATTRHNLPALGFQVLWEQRLEHLKGTVLVAAAGNDGDRGPFWPAAFPWAVAVGALDEMGRRAAYSNHGSWVDVYALGSDVVNAFPNGRYVYADPPSTGDITHFDREMAVWSGTSFATPQVAGLIAARMSRTGESGRHAADGLLRIAHHHARRGVGPVLEPGMGCLDDPRPCGWSAPCACGGGCRTS